MVYDLVDNIIIRHDLLAVKRIEQLFLRRKQIMQSYSTEGTQPNMNKLVFGERLRKLLETGGHKYKRPVSQAELSKALGITRQAISSYLNEATLPTIDKMTMIAEFFDVSYDYLIGYSESEIRQNSMFVDCLGLSEKSISVLTRMKRLQDACKQGDGQQEHSELDILNRFIVEGSTHGLFSQISMLCDLMRNGIETPSLTMRMFDIEVEAERIADKEGVKLENSPQLRALESLSEHAKTLGCRVIGAGDEVEFASYQVNKTLNFVYDMVIMPLREQYMLKQAVQMREVYGVRGDQDGDN